MNLSTTGWIPARSTTEQRRSAPWEIASADVPWPDWPRGDLNLATLERLGREKDLTYIATLCSAGLIRLDIFERRLDATDINTAKPETGCECKHGRTRRNLTSGLLGFRVRSFLAGSVCPRTAPSVRGCLGSLCRPVRIRPPSGATR